MRIALTVNKANVYDEVAKASAYAGAKKMAEDQTAYNRIFTTDEDRLLLERFWVETCNNATNSLKPFIVSVGTQPISHGIDLSRNYNVELEVSASYDTVLTESAETSLYTYFVLAILAKWYALTNKVETEATALEAAASMKDVLQKIYYRKKPTRVAPPGY